MLAAAEEHYRSQQRVTAAAVMLARRQWDAGMGADDLDGTWAATGPRIVAAVSATQILAAKTADGYTSAALAEQGIADDPAGAVNPSAFSGVAADGRPLLGLLFASVVATREAFSRGTSRADALAAGRSRLDMLVATTVQDTRRAAVSTAMVARPAVTRYVRVLNPPSCSRCAILAGSTYRLSEAFDRHPRCFPAGVMVSGPASDAATRRWYEGELVVLATASGQELSLTGNHPILTSRGWLPANFLREGDEVVRSTRIQGATALVVPDHDQMPSLIEDVWRAFGVSGLHRMPTSPQDFHGDGQEGEVDVVYADSPLADRNGTTLFEPVGEQEFTRRIRRASFLHLKCAAELVDLWDVAHPSCGIGRGDLPLPFYGTKLGVSEGARCAHSPAFDSGVSQNTSYGAARHTVLASQCVFTDAGGKIGRGDGIWRRVNTRPRWDAPTFADHMEHRRGYAAVGIDLLNRLTGQVELDRVVRCRSVQFRGHVYGLTSSEGWHAANSLIVSNCDCVNLGTDARHAPGLALDPQAYFDSLSEAEQDRVFTRAGAQAVRDGAGLGRVVNARRGMSTMTAYGRQVRATTEGTTRRGLFGRAEATAGRAGRSPRLMPESIYEIATDREDAIRLLRRFGFIT